MTIGCEPQFFLSFLPSSTILLRLSLSLLASRHPSRTRPTEVYIRRSVYISIAKNSNRIVTCFSANQPTATTNRPADPQHPPRRFDTRNRLHHMQILAAVYHQASPNKWKPCSIEAKRRAHWQGSTLPAIAYGRQTENAGMLHRATCLARVYRTTKIWQTCCRSSFVPVRFSRCFSSPLTSSSSEPLAISLTDPIFSSALQPNTPINNVSMAIGTPRPQRLRWSPGEAWIGSEQV